MCPTRKPSRASLYWMAASYSKMHKHLLGRDCRSSRPSFVRQHKVQRSRCHFPLWSEPRSYADLRDTNPANVRIRNRSVLSDGYPTFAVLLSPRPCLRLPGPLR
jgi:hypothetical protein